MNLIELGFFQLNYKIIYYIALNRLDFSFYFMLNHELHFSDPLVVAPSQSPPLLVTLAQSSVKLGGGGGSWWVLPQYFFPNVPASSQRGPLTRLFSLTCFEYFVLIGWEVNLLIV